MQVFDVSMQLEWFDVLLLLNIPKYTTTFAKRVRQRPLMMFISRYHIFCDDTYEYEFELEYRYIDYIKQTICECTTTFMWAYLKWFFLSYYQLLHTILNLVMSLFVFANFIYCSDFVLVHQASLVRQSTSFLFERVRAMWEESFYRYIFYRRENLIIFVSRKIRMTRYILYIRVVGKLDCLPIFCIEYWYKFTCYLLM